VAALYASVNARRLDAIVPAAEEAAPAASRRVVLARWAVPALCFAAGVAVGTVGVPASWAAMVATGACLTFTGAVLAMAADPDLRLAVLRAAGRLR
jgi:hypothetical protein